MSKIEQQLENLAAVMNVQLVYSKRLDVSLNAAWHPATRVILIRHNLDPATRVCAIAHELGHAHYGHNCSNEQAEREADEWAALHLLDFRTVKAAAYACEHNPGAIAAELGVTPRLLAVWMRLYESGRMRYRYGRSLLLGDLAEDKHEGFENQVSKRPVG